MGPGVPLGERLCAELADGEPGWSVGLSARAWVPSPGADVLVPPHEGRRGSPGEQRREPR